MSERAPGRPAVLSRPLIVAAARRIADREGLDAITVRAVAQSLGTGQASLYRHITDRRELLALLADDVAARLPAAHGDGGPDERFAGQWLAAYDHLERHRWAARIIAVGEYPSDGGAPFARSALSVMIEASGADRAAALRAYRVLWHMLMGHLLDAHPVGHTEDGGPPPVAPDGGPGEPPSARGDFAWALPLVLAGLRRTARGS